MQIKTTVKYQHAPIRTAKIQNTDDTKRWKGCEATGTLVHCWWGCQLVQLLWKTAQHFLMKLSVSSCILHHAFQQLCCLFLTVPSSNCVLRYLLKGVDNLHPRENLHVDVGLCSRFIYHHQTSEATEMSFGQWRDKLRLLRQWIII